jgi:hypothetical protein
MDIDDDAPPAFAERSRAVQRASFATPATRSNWRLSQDLK